MRMKIVPIIVCILFLLHSYASGQDIAEGQSNKNITLNIVYIDFGSGFYGANIGINYERIIYSGNTNTISLKGAYGFYSYFMPSGDYYNISGHYSYGRRFINLETAIGISFQDREGSIKPLKFKNIEVFPLIYLGCKLKKPTGNYVMKIGVGYPQILSWGFGFAF
jgi:hypothetical protein